MKRTGRYELLEHTADIAIRITAGDLSELFRAAMRGMYHVIGEISQPRKGRLYHWQLQADDPEQLLHDWLGELLYWFQVRKIVFGKVDFAQIDGRHLRGQLLGRDLDTVSCVIHREIKAVTYHELKVQGLDQQADGDKGDRLVQATVIFDI